MSEPNPYRLPARLFAFACYGFAALVLFAGTFFTLAAATMDEKELDAQLRGTSSWKMALMAAGPFLVVAAVAIAVGLGAQTLLGRWRLPEKVVAKSAVGCLGVTSLGCGLWSLFSAFITLAIGRLFFLDQPAGLKEVFIGLSGPAIAILVMLAAAWFVRVNYTRLNPAERELVYRKYQDELRIHLHNLGDPRSRAQAQESTIDMLADLDRSQKGTLLVFLGESGLLNRVSGIDLRQADFRGADLSGLSLPEAALGGIRLDRANLRGASFFQADLRGATLRDADLSDANLQGAQLQGANLTGAILDRAHLGRANLERAIVSPSQLNRAILEKTTMPEGTLSD